jgi:hypothetical protein
MTMKFITRRTAILAGAAILACAPSVALQGAENLAGKVGAIPDFSSGRVMWALIGGHKLPQDSRR